MATRINWFGGHMARTVRELKDRLRLVDLVLEVRDARIPLSSNNPELSNLVQHKRRLIVLNKTDLAAPDKQQAVKHALDKQGLSSVFISTQRAVSVHHLLKKTTNILRDAKPKADVLMIMTIGVPNSGKSSLINALRHAAKVKKASSAGEKVKKTGSDGKAATGPSPGLTRQIAGFQVGTQPTTFIMDTPGVMLPHVPDEQTGMRLALVGAIRDSVVRPEALVRHLLWELACQPELAVPKQSQSQRMATAKRVYLPSAVEAAVMSMKQLHADALPQSSRAQPVAASRSRTASERAAPTSVDATVQKSGAVSTGQHPASQTTKTGIQSSAAENGWKQQGCENSTDKGIATHTLSHNDKDDRESGDAASDMTRAQKAKADCTHTGLVILQQVLKADVLDVDKLNATYRKVIEAYRTGLLGRYTLDL